MGNALVVVNLFCSYEAVKDAYSWSMLENALFFGFSRISYALAILMIFYAVVMGHFRIGLTVCQNSYMRGLGKLSYACGLLSPIVINIAYCT